MVTRSQLSGGRGSSGDKLFRMSVEVLLSLFCGTRKNHVRMHAWINIFCALCIICLQSALVSPQSKLCLKQGFEMSLKASAK